MNKLIKEDITRIKELMGGIITESEYNSCERFSDNKQKFFVCKKIGSLKQLLHNNEGMGLKNIIDQKIESLKSEIPKDLKTKFIEGAELLQSKNKISQSLKTWFIENKVKNGTLVYIDGEWQPINKLNTNYFDLAELLTDLIYKGGDNTKSLIQSVIKEPIEGLNKIKPYLQRLIEKYFEDPNMLYEYTKNIQRTTAIGESAERRVKEHLEDNGFKLLYEGGNGDLIDMTFGIDLLMEHPKLGVKTIQVKNTEYSWNKEEKYEYVEWLIIATPFTIYNNKTREIIQL